MSSSARVLFLYPNERDMSLVPPVFGLFSALLKQRGHTVGIFDCTGYNFEGHVDPDVEAERVLCFKPVEAASAKGVKAKLTNMYDDLVGKVEEFSPDIIAMSITESTFLRGMMLLDHLRERKRINILTIVGGVFPTFAPQLVMNRQSVDIVCVGEGENALTTLCDRVARGEDFERIPNLWVRRPNGEVIKNPPGPAVDIDQLPPIDFSIFEDDRFYRPMRGKIYRMLPVETHRGCPYTCTFCNSPTQNTLYNDATRSKFFRKASSKKMREELVNFRDNWKGEYVFFWADTFLAWSSRELAEFCEMYSEFKFPFWCQSRPETVHKNVGGPEKIRMLMDVGLHHMSFGLEHGNEEFRREVLDRNYANQYAIDALQHLVALGLPFTINNITGFPEETRALAFDTIELNRQIESFNLSCSTFAPYWGTALRERAVKRGYMSNDVIAPSNSEWSVLDMPGFTKEAIYALQRVFVMYCKFPKSRWSEIEQAEQLTPKGDSVWNALRDEFLETYFKEPEPAIEKNLATLDA